MLDPRRWIPDTDDLDGDGDGIPDDRETVLTGTVTNSSGFVMPGATIQPENRNTTTGVIDLQNLPNETLAINVSADGYQNRSLVVEAPAKSYDTALVPTSDPTLPPRGERRSRERTSSRGLLGATPSRGASPVHLSTVA